MGPRSQSRRPLARAGGAWGRNSGPAEGGEQPAGAGGERAERGLGEKHTVDLSGQDEFSEVTTVTGVKRPLHAASEEIGAEPLASWPAGRPDYRDLDGEDGGL
eukprot:13654425-Alexandrium_andersonii.AAC.1